MVGAPTPKWDPIVFFPQPFGSPLSRVSTIWLCFVFERSSTILQLSSVQHTSPFFASCFKMIFGATSWITCQIHVTSYKETISDDFLRDLFSNRRTKISGN